MMRETYLVTGVVPADGRCSVCTGAGTRWLWPPRGPVLRYCADCLDRLRATDLAAGQGHLWQQQPAAQTVEVTDGT